MMEKAERFAPGAGKKHRAKADADYARAVVDGNSERDRPGTAQSAPAAAAAPNGDPNGDPATGHPDGDPATGPGSSTR
jgi:hypothetical protein